MNGNKLYCSMCDNSLSIYTINDSLPDGTYSQDLSTEEWIDYVYKEFGWTTHEDCLTCPECLGY